MKEISLLALSGSLRQESYNMAALHALKDLAPDNVEIEIGSIDLPLFNPDRENDDIPALDGLKSSLAVASGLIIASPEYAHGISGPMKNALDWLVSGVEFPYKPVMLINTSPRAHHAQDALMEVLTTMSANIVNESCITIPLLSSGLDSEGILASNNICRDLAEALDIFIKHLE